MRDIGKKVEKRSVVIGSERAGGKEYVQISDAETGEIIDAFWRERREKPSGRPPEKSRSPDFFKLYCENWNYIVRKKKLSLTEIGFFASLLTFVGFESNYLVHPDTRKNVSCREIAALLCMDVMRVHEYMTRLNEKGLVAIVKLGTGRPNHYILNSHVVFKGNRIKNMSEHDRFNDSPLYLPVKVRYKEVTPPCQK